MRQFLKYTFASILGTLVSVVLLVVLGMGGFIVLLASLAAKDTTPQVKDRSVLVLDLGLRINDTEPSSTTTTAINEALSGTTKRTITLREFLDTVEGRSPMSGLSAYIYKGRILMSESVGAIYGKFGRR